MFTPGDYRISKTMGMNEEKQCFELVDIQTVIDAAEDEDDRRETEQMAAMILRIDENGKCTYLSPIPDTVTDAEIEEAKADGARIEGRMIITDEKDGKVENGELFIHDEQKMLTGEEWVKVSTDVDGELNMVMAVYSKI